MKGKILKTVSVDGKAEFKCCNGMNTGFVQIKITGIMPYNKDKVSIFNLDINAIDLLQKSLLKFNSKKLAK